MMTTKKSTIEELTEGFCKDCACYLDHECEMPASYCTNVDEFFQYLASTGKVYIKDENQSMPKYLRYFTNSAYEDLSADILMNAGFIQARPLKDVLECPR